MFEKSRDVPVMFCFNVHFGMKCFYNSSFSPQGRRCKFGASLHVQSKQRRHVAGFHKLEIKPKYVQIRLAMLSHIYHSIESLKMDIFHIISQSGHCIFPRWANGLPVVHLVLLRFYVFICLHICSTTEFYLTYQSGRSPKVVALFLLQT